MVELNVVPDIAIRAGIRYLLSKRVKESTPLSGKVSERKKQQKEEGEEKRERTSIGRLDAELWGVRMYLFWFY